MDLKTPIHSAGRTYKMYSRKLEKLGINTLEDLLYHIPFRYEDYSIVSKIASVQPGETVTVQGTIAEIKNEYTRRFKTIQKAKIEDETGSIEAVWFNQPYIPKVVRAGDRVSLSGKIGNFGKKQTLESPAYEVINQENETIHTGRLVPVYHEVRGVSSKWLRRQIHKILRENKKTLNEYLPDSISENNELMELSEAIEQIHFPKSLKEIEEARNRLAFDELFLAQLSVFKRKSEWEKNLKGNLFSITQFKKHIEMFWEKLPFELTRAQKRATQEIFKDLAREKPMNRLLEGEVGSGKTVVSAIAMYLTHLNGFQSVLMAPTEILAQQHYRTITDLLAPFGVKVELITGNKKLKKNWKFDILIGTHAVLSEKIEFARLGLVVIDEQQRFGVEQRSVIRQKGKNPHVLIMTATPIPRTVALTMYGDLDLSYLDEMPVGRKLVKTWLVPPQKREAAYKWLKKQIEQGNQVFIICPFIEESESMQTVKAASKEFERLQKSVFSGLRLGLLHGRLKAREKEKVLDDFRERKTDILVATPVVEVGIDIPNATIILIEAAERFGLAQLHQLRGRVGRGDKQSYCLLFTETKNEQTLQRFKAMETIHNGSELAELDLQLRGPGELYGTKQHGVPELKVASFSDRALIEKTRAEAQKIFPYLSKHPQLIEKLRKTTLQNVSPD